MSKYRNGKPQWEAPGNTSRNHWIATVTDCINGGREVFSCYFDGTQREALAHFKAKPELQQRRRAGYQITVRANSLVLWDGYASE